MDIGYDTVIYALLALIFIPLLTFRPSTLLYLLVLMTMFPLYFRSQISIGYINIYSLDLVTAFFCFYAGCVILIKYVSKKEIFRIPDNSKPLLYFILFYFVLHLTYLVAGIFQGVPIDSGIRRFLGFSGFFFFFAPILFIKDKKQLKNLLLFTLILVVLFPIYQIYKFSIRIHFADIMTSSGTMRITSDGIPVIAAGLFMILIWNKQLRYYLLAACPLVSILFSGHRSAYLSVAVSLMVLFYFQKQLSKPILFLFFTGFSLCATLIGVEVFTGHSFASDAIRRSQDIFSHANVTTMARRYAINDNLFIFKQKPIFGIGYNEEILPKLFSRSDYSNRRVTGPGDMGDVFNILHPHNFLLRSLSNTGLMGTSVLFCIIYLVFRRCYALIRTRGDYHQIGIFLFCSIFFFLIFSLMNTNFFSEGYVFWILCGIAAICGDDFFAKDKMPAAEL